jgi:hypothetical protein
MEKVGLKIVELIHELNQMHYEVKFCPDFSGMSRVELTDEFDSDFYQHSHLGCPGTERIVLEKAIIKQLSEWVERYKKDELYET